MSDEVKIGTCDGCDFEEIPVQTAGNPDEERNLCEVCMNMHQPGDHDLAHATNMILREIRKQGAS